MFPIRLAPLAEKLGTAAHHTPGDLEVTTRTASFVFQCPSPLPTPFSRVVPNTQFTRPWRRLQNYDDKPLL